MDQRLSKIEFFAIILAMGCYFIGSNLLQNAPKSSNMLYDKIIAKIWKVFQFHFITKQFLKLKPIVFRDARSSTKYGPIFPAIFRFYYTTYIFFLILSKIPNLLFTTAFYSLGLLYCKHINYSNICITILPLPYSATVF